MALANNTMHQIHYLKSPTVIVSGEGVSFALECGLPIDKGTDGLGK